MNLHPNTNDAYRLLHNGTLALMRAEQQGMRVDMDYIECTTEQLTQQIDELEVQLKKTKFFRHWQHSRGNRAVNINSDVQLGNYIYNRLGLTPVKLTDSGRGAVDEESLLALEIPELESIIKIRKMRKNRDTYLGGFAREQVDGYVHPFFHLHFVRTYRSSSDRPNFQNIPKRDKEAQRITRQALYPRPGHQLLEFDYGALEVRIAACYHQDPNMLKYIREGHDLHADMTQQIFNINKYDKATDGHAFLRSAVKNGFVFPQFYGDYYGNNAVDISGNKWCGLKGERWKPGQGVGFEGAHISDHLISHELGSLQKFTDHLKDIEQDFWENRFPDYAAWKRRWWAAYRKFGYIDMKTGFRCSGLMERNDATNYPIQGSAFHCLLWSFIELDRLMQLEKWDTRLIGQIHDAIIFDVNPAELTHVIETIRRVTTQDLPQAWKWINVPLEVEGDLFPIDGSWASESIEV